MGGEDYAGGGADLGELLHSQDVAYLVNAAAAVLLRDGQAHHAQLRHLPDGLGRKALGLVKLLGQGLYLVLGKFAERLLQLDVLLGEIKHGFSVLSHLNMNSRSVFCF